MVFAILLVGFTPLSYSSEESEAREDIQAGCRDGNTLVFRYAYKDYVCVSPDTAKRWAELGLAEIYQEFTPEKQEKKPVPLKPQFNEQPATPPPKKTTSSASDDSECRDGYSLVFRFVHGDTFCTSPSTAASWERLGLAEILVKANEPKQIESTSKVLPEKEMIKEDDETENEIDEIENEIKEKIIPTQKSPINQSLIPVLPDYPSQPTIHPEIEASNSFWNPPEIHQVNDRIWVAVGFDSANSIMIEGEKGILIVDTLSSYEAAKNVLSEFRKITDKPVKTIILTHGHLDHVQGTKAFLESGDGNVEIIAHETMLDLYLNENGILGPINEKRSAYATGLFLPDSGSDKANLGVFPPMIPGTNGFVSPTHTFSKTFSLDISGVKMELIHAGGESPDQIFVWLPEDDTLLTGDNLYDVFPNIYSIKGTPYRDPLDYIAAYDQALLLEPEYLVPSHSKPILGSYNVNLVLITTRDAIQFIHDQTIRGINDGYSVDELSRMIVLPEWLENRPWLTQVRSEIPWHVKQIYYGTVGWYEGDPASLITISSMDRAEKITNAFGGIEDTIEEIYDSIENEEYYWAAELSSHVLEIDPENTEAKSLKAYALRVIGQQMISADGRNWALTSALELEGKIDVTSALSENSSYDALSNIPLNNLLQILPTRVNPAEIDDDVYVIHAIHSDDEQEFTLYFRNGVLLIFDELISDADNSLTLSSDMHRKLVSGNLDLSDGIKSGQISITGNPDELKRWMSSIGPISFSSTGLRD
ncbi:alkyl sulfatase dimerization domain-containing protein [Nitrosopumilus sp. S4]